MNGQYYRWTMNKTPSGYVERDFVTQDINPKAWTFTDNRFLNGQAVTWRVGEHLTMRAGEQDEIIGYPEEVVITGFDLKVAGMIGPAAVVVKVVRESAHNSACTKGAEVAFDSELARCAYQPKLCAAALVA